MPDFLYAEVLYCLGSSKDYPELYEVRRLIRGSVKFGEWIFMEDVANKIADAVFAHDGRAQLVIVRLPFNRHRVEVER